LARTLCFVIFFEPYQIILRFMEPGILYVKSDFIMSVDGTGSAFCLMAAKPPVAAAM